MNWKIDEKSHLYISTLIIKYRSYLDTERFLALCSEAAKFFNWKPQHVSILRLYARDESQPTPEGPR